MEDLFGRISAARASAAEESAVMHGRAEAPAAGGAAAAAGGAAAEAEIDEIEAHLGNFFKVVGAIKRSMRTVEGNVDELRGLTGKIQREFDSGQFRKDAAELVTASDAIMKAIAERLKQLGDKVKERQRGIAEDRIFEGIVNTLSRDFTRLMADYQQVENDYRERCREDFVRQYRIAHPEASAEQLNQLKYSDENQAVFREALLEAEHAVATNRLADIQERHLDIVQLSQSIHELHQLFIDMANLVEQQGELIHQIEHNVSKAKDYVVKGESELVKAVKSQSSARKKTCCVLILVIVILTIILAPTLITQLGRA